MEFSLLGQVYEPRNERQFVWIMWFDVCIVCRWTLKATPAIFRDMCRPHTTLSKVNDDTCTGLRVRADSSAANTTDTACAPSSSDG